MKFQLNIWRQDQLQKKGEFIPYDIEGVSPSMSFLEMLDLLNEKLIIEKDHRGAITFDHDCREGICGSCGLFINGRAHGPQRGVATCQLYMRQFHEQELIVVEPWRSEAFPVIKDLVVDRSAFDRIISRGGYISVNVGGAPDGNNILIAKDDQEWALDAAECIACGACVAACKNASALLFVSSKIAHLARLPQGQIERDQRVLSMFQQMDEEGFGACTNTEACSVECPKLISMDTMAFARKEYLRAKLNSITKNKKGRRH